MTRRIISCYCYWLWFGPFLYFFCHARGGHCVSRYPSSKELFIRVFQCLLYPRLVANLAYLLYFISHPSLVLNILHQSANWAVNRKNYACNNKEANNRDNDKSNCRFLNAQFLRSELEKYKRYHQKGYTTQKHTIVTWLSFTCVWGNVYSVG